MTKQLIVVYFLLLSLKFCAGYIDLSDTDYCALCKEKKSHTACQYPTNKQPGPCVEQPLTMDEKKSLLRQHNELRAKVARGQQEPQPAAANMMRMRWDFELEAIARRWALQCKDAHDKCRDSSRFSVGQNIAWQSRWNTEEMTLRWYNEVTSVDPADVDSYKFDMKTGHYTQLVWADSYLLGCGKTDRGKAPEYRFTLICNYGPGGNFINKPIYKRGDPSSACPSGTSKDKKYNGLCVKSGSDFENMKLHASIRLKAPATTLPMPLTVLLILAMIFRKCWDVMCAITGT